MFLDRAATWIAIYVLLVGGLVWSRDSVSTTLFWGNLAAFTAVLLHKIREAVLLERHVDSLGARAPETRSWTPFNIGVLFEAMYWLTRHNAARLWWRLMAQNKLPNHPHTIEFITMGTRMCFTIDEENIKAVLATQFQDFGKGEEFREEWKDFLGLSIFTTDGELWHNSRALLRPHFIRDRISDLHNFEKHTQILLAKLGESGEGATVAVDDLFFRYALDAATEFLFGTSVDSLRNGQQDFAAAFAEVQRVQGQIARVGPISFLLPKRSFYSSLKVLNNFVDKYVDQALRMSPEELEKGKTDENYTFLHALAANTRDRAVLRDSIVAVLLAGRDTTASTLCWLFYELSKHPDVVVKLREEMARILGPSPGRAPTYADLKNMSYLRHTIDETLRLYPVVPFNVRVALKDTTLPRGGGRDGLSPIGIPKDTPIGYSTFVMQRRPDLYPPTSPTFPHYLEFAPERWEHWTPRSWTFIPFNGGPRICLGQQFALTEMSYTVVRILQTFSRIESRQDTFPGFKSDIVLQPAAGVRVALFRDEKS